MQSAAVDEAVRAVLASEARLSRPSGEVGGGEDLFRLGLDSHAVVGVMLALEERLGLEFPEARLTRATFSTIDGIVGALQPLAAAS